MIVRLRSKSSAHLQTYPAVVYSSASRMAQHEDFALEAFSWASAAPVL
jgi:hypothetical protein